MEIPKTAVLSGGRIKGGDSRLRAAYHKLSRRYHRDTFRPMRVGNETSVSAQAAEAEQRFRRVAVACEVLKDAARRATYVPSHCCAPVSRCCATVRHSLLLYCAQVHGNEPRQRGHQPPAWCAHEVFKR